jgi:hypothetical protein
MAAIILNEHFEQKAPDSRVRDLSDVFKRGPRTAAAPEAVTYVVLPEYKVSAGERSFPVFNSFAIGNEDLRQLREHGTEVRIYQSREDADQFADYLNYVSQGECASEMRSRAVTLGEKTPIEQKGRAPTVSAMVPVNRYPV